MISAIHIENTVYVDLRAEQVYTSTFLSVESKFNDGISVGNYLDSSELTHRTLSEIHEEFSDWEQSIDNLIIALDFEFIGDVQKNLQELLLELAKACKQLILINVSSMIVDKLGLQTFKEKNGNEQTFYEAFYLSTVPLSVNIIQSDQRFESKLEEVLLVYSDDMDQYPHKGSSVYLSKYVDVKAVIINERYFLNYVIYKLARKIKDKVDSLEYKNDFGEEDPVLFCQSLTSSYIASVLSGYLGYDLLLVDQIGPINKTYSELENRIVKGKNYLVISDLVCIGTEVRVSKNIIEFSGGIYGGNACIVRIQTMKEEDQYEDTMQMIEISGKDNFLGFKISTSLDFDN